MPHFEYSSRLDASPEKVFGVLGDMTRWRDRVEPLLFVDPTGPFFPLAPGAEYEWRVGKWGLSLLWSIAIEDVLPGQGFKERQIKGPFSYWIHTHKLEPHGDGTLLNEIIDYDLDFGIVGKLLSDLIVRRELQRLFEHAHVKLRQQL